MPRKPIPAITRAWKRIIQGAPNKCWPWTGAINSRKRGGPYGHLQSDVVGKNVYVHRLVYQHEIGPIPEGYEVDHRCKNTLCCNPGHLEAVPPLVNNMRSTSPPILNIRKEECPQGHAYDVPNTGFRSGKSWRYCRACARGAQRAKRKEGKTYPEWRATVHEPV